MRIPGFSPPPAFGNRAQVGATVQELQDVLGNRDGIWGNEDLAAGQLGNRFDRNPLSERLQQFAGVGLSVSDELKLLGDFQAKQEQTWGMPVSTLGKDDFKRAGGLFLVQKSIQLTRMGRTPDTVVDAYVPAKGTFDGQALPDRDIFTQRYKPTTTPSGKVVVLSPGFQETGRHFEQQIAKMNALGHEVITLDHQWAGQSDGSPGGLDRGAGVARDVAAVCAHAAKIAQDEYGAQGDVVLFGNSMGAGPGVLGALTLTQTPGDDGKPRLQLDSGPMPQGIKAVLQSPYLGATDNVVNQTLDFASQLPFVNRLQTPAMGLPVLTSDAGAAQRGAQSAVLEDVRAQVRSMSSAQDDLDVIWDALKAGHGPTGAQLQVVIADKDPLASPDKAKELGATVGAHVELVDSKNHVFEQSDTEMQHGLDALARLLASS